MFRVVDWDKNFENNRTRELVSLSWVPFPNKHDGDGYTALLDDPDGAAHYGAWCAIVQVASKCGPRGTLVRDGAKPHSAGSLSRMTRIPEAIMRRALERLSGEIGWLEIISDPVSPTEVSAKSQEGATSSHKGASRVRAKEWNGMEGNGIEGNGREDSSEPGIPASEPEPTIGEPWVTVGECKAWQMPTAFVVRQRQAFPDLDIDAELSKARAWLDANPGRRKTARGMPKFLNGWLSRAQDSRGGSSRAAASKDPRGTFAAAARYLETTGGSP